jgi:hypothetical protein
LSVFIAVDLLIEIVRVRNSCPGCFGKGLNMEKVYNRFLKTKGKGATDKTIAVDVKTPVGLPDGRYREYGIGSMKLAALPMVIGDISLDLAGNRSRAGTGL